MDMVGHYVTQRDAARFNRLQDEVYKPVFRMIDRAGHTQLAARQALSLVGLLFGGLSVTLICLATLEQQGVTRVHWGGAAGLVGAVVAIAGFLALNFWLSLRRLRREAALLWVKITLSFPYAMEADDWCLTQLKELAYD